MSKICAINISRITFVPTKAGTGVSAYKLKNTNNMKVYSELTLRNFNAWSDAVATKEAILNANLENEFESLIEELYPDGIDETQLNDILWFEKEWIFETLGMPQED